MKEPSAARPPVGLRRSPFAGCFLRGFPRRSRVALAPRELHFEGSQLGDPPKPKRPPGKDHAAPPPPDASPDQKRRLVGLERKGHPLGARSQLGADNPWIHHGDDDALGQELPP